MNVNNPSASAHIRVLPCRCRRMRCEERAKLGQKRNTLLTASHSFRSSPGGSLTASLRFPLPRVASICFLSCAPCIVKKKIKESDESLQSNHGCLYTNTREARKRRYQWSLCIIGVTRQFWSKMPGPPTKLGNNNGPSSLEQISCYKSFFIF